MKEVRINEIIILFINFFILTNMKKYFLLQIFILNIYQNDEIFSNNSCSYKINYDLELRAFASTQSDYDMS